jgi:heme exporter protein C
MRISLVCFAIGFVLVLLAVYNATIVLPESANPTLKNNYRIIFFHLPSAITSFLAFTTTLIFSILYLLRGKAEYDIYASTSAKAGVFLISSALISGSVWAKVAWGSYWNWDPRETIVLILWFVYAGYFALRVSIEDLETKAKNSAIYSIFGYAVIPLSYLSAYIGFSLHPTTSELKIGVDVGLTLGMMVFGFILLYFAFLTLEGRVERIILLLEEIKEVEEIEEIKVFEETKKKKGEDGSDDEENEK